MSNASPTRTFLQCKIGTSILALSICLIVTLCFGGTTEAVGKGRRILVPEISLAGEVGRETSHTLVAAIYVSNLSIPVAPPPSAGQSQRHEPHIIVAAYDDGMIVWSEDPVNGGGKYLKSAVPAENIKNLLAVLGSRGAFKNSLLEAPQFPPDSEFTTIFARSGSNLLYMRSCHETAEQNPHLVVTSRGIEGLKGRNRNQVLKEDKKEYQDYRAEWSAIKQQIIALISEEAKASATAAEIQDIGDRRIDLAGSLTK